MNEKQQKYILEKLLSSPDILSICIGVIVEDYFDPKLRPAVSYILDYFNKYNSAPEFDDINSKFDLSLAKKEITKPVIASTCDEVEAFCQESGLSDAVIQAMDLINQGERGKVREVIDKALMISLKKDLGIDMFHGDVAGFLESCVDTQQNISTGIRGLDDFLNGGLGRKTLTMLSAMSGGGKSVMMTNLGVNYAKMGFNVVYFSLELSKEMVGVRTASIITGVGTKVWKENRKNIAEQIKKFADFGAGSFVITRLPNGSCANDIRAFLKQYELETKKIPDVIIVDYLDIMNPNGGARGMSVSEKDKASAEELVNILHDYDAIGITASQQNRESLRNSSPDQGVIAGGMTKVNTVDNYISISIPEATRAEGIMYAHFLKTRSSDGVGKSTTLKYDSSCLQITDPNGAVKLSINVLANRKKQLEDLKEHVKYEFSDGNIFPDAGEFSGNPELAALIEKINEEEAELEKEEKIQQPESLDLESIYIDKTGHTDEDDVIVVTGGTKPSKINYKQILKGIK